MTAQERTHAERVELAAANTVATMHGGNPDDAKRAARNLFHKAVLLRRAQITRRDRNRAARDRADVMRSLGMVRTPFGWE
jgi:hypothetical protein